MKKSNTAIYDTSVVMNLSANLNNEVSEIENQTLESESMGGVYLYEAAYIHEGSNKNAVIQVVGMAQPSMSESNILWLF
jgi:hypothetical protein